MTSYEIILDIKRIQGYALSVEAVYARSRKQGVQNELTEVARSQSEWIGESLRQGEYSLLIG